MPADVKKFKEIQKSINFSIGSYLLKKLSISFEIVLGEVVKIIHFIKSWPLNNCLFKMLREDMGSVHASLFYLLKFNGNLKKKY